MPWAALPPFSCDRLENALAGVTYQLDEAITCGRHAESRGLLLAVSIGLTSGALGYVSLAAAIIGAILGAMSRATKQGKAGMILSLVSLVITVLSFAFFSPRPVLTITRDQDVETPRTK